MTVELGWLIAGLLVVLYNLRALPSSAHIAHADRSIGVS
jgi:hypothetical protein